MAITRIRIFPSIGIARIGNAEIIGPEIPGKHERPDGGYKDATCRIKRQAARFRLYAYDENDQLIFENGKPKEITAADGVITWRVELANIKGSARRFYPLDSTERRNKDIDAALVEITPEPRKLAGANQAAKFDDGSDTTTVSLAQQHDDLNLRTIEAAGKDETEAHAYFGCWLDLNQDEPLFPSEPGNLLPDGPWPASVERLSVQQLMKAEHQCVVAEIHFPADPVPSKATMDDRRLAQRNLVFVGAANPGAGDTRTVQHTFAIKAVARLGAKPTDPTDELMIRWETLPRDTRMLLYMPELDAGEVQRLAGKVMGPSGLEPIDPHTLRCGPADVTYVPIRPGHSRPIAALMTLELPAGIKRGQLFGLSVHQVAGRPRRVVGSFQFNIPVSTSAALLGPEIRRLSVLRHIARAIPIDDPWHAVFVRYLAQIAARVRGFGGDPDAVAPAADGSGRDPAQIRCERLERLFAALLAVAVVLGGVVRPPVGALLALAALVIAAIAEWYWRKTCAPPWCRIALAGGAGVVIGAAVLGLLWLLGLGGASLVTWLAIAAVLAAALVVGALASGCCRSPPGA